MGQGMPRKTETILIVDDEAIIRFELVDLFEEAGYRVFEARDADEAIEILEFEREIQVVLTDVRMPGSMDGLRLAHYVRERYPPTLLLVMSGAQPIADSELPDHSTFLAKPFDPERLLGQIDRMIR